MRYIIVLLLLLSSCATGEHHWYCRDYCHEQGKPVSTDFKGKCTCYDSPFIK